MKSCSLNLAIPDMKLLEYLRSSKGVFHPRFHDLMDSRAVRMRNGQNSAVQSIHEEQSTIIHLTITGRCYAKCKGCINSAVTLAVEQQKNRLLAFQECDPERDSSIILDLTKSIDGNQVTICFYGGEPFLAIEKMENVRQILTRSSSPKHFRYMVYTNGELIEEGLHSHAELMESIWLYSVSIDGDEEQHNRIRGGTQLNRIIKNLEVLKNHKRGHVLFWSTLREEQSLFTCFQQFMRLHEEGLVDHFFWHWAETKEAFKDFAYYVRRYGEDLERIMESYVLNLSKGRFLPIAHINELVLYLATGRERGHSACAVELAKNYDILDGKVFACADLPAPLGSRSSSEGGLKETDLQSLVKYKDWLGCPECGVHPYCGGRCPVQALAGSPERTVQYCQLMRLHVGIVQERMQDIGSALDQTGTSLQEIYDGSAFLAKYTDVVP